MNTLTELFGSMVFNESVMRERLPAEVYEALRRTMDRGEPLDLSSANTVASAMKDWAMEHGVTHYTHWFQPMTGVTAEKHDSFLTPAGEGTILAEFSGKELIQGEPDASSLPSGGLRATFEARGYTAWDPTSYAFIKDNVLCIPTAFCSYGGEALDKKTPLLRSMDAINRQALRVARLFGTECSHITPMVGPEQEYFLLDRDAYTRRKDLIYTGRTLFGARPPKGQELEDHYFGALKLRVSAFMKELNEELWKLGVQAKTEHNETAPAQHELAPVYAKCNLSVDHNQLTMEIMRKTAERHNLTCLLHEKPFEGINGSGKHNNWSLSTDRGENLFSSKDDPDANLRFIVFMCAVIQAVDEYQDLLRISVASAGNDHRLGGFEAPPAILSIYVGEDLYAILEGIESGDLLGRMERSSLNTGAAALPKIPRDTSDRNRTSPLAFTGNKFELRTLGASMSTADCNTVLNTAVADVLMRYADELETAEDFHAAVDALLRRAIREHKRILFNGNGYDDSWKREAERRGLSNYATTADAVPHLTDPKNVALMERQGVMSATELAAVRDIMLENYTKALRIEARVMAEMARRDIIPAVIGYAGGLAGALNAKRQAMPDLACESETGLLRRVSELCDRTSADTDALENCIAAERLPANLVQQAAYFRDTVIPAMAQLRRTVDTLEPLVSKEAWPYPSYGHLLYLV